MVYCQKCFRTIKKCAKQYLSEGPANKICNERVLLKIIKIKIDLPAYKKITSFKHTLNFNPKRHMYCESFFFPLREPTVKPEGCQNKTSTFDTSHNHVNEPRGVFSRSSVAQRSQAEPGKTRRPQSHHYAE